ncbi:hypothetical protein [Devosia sp. DBB001]|nr:hypothetical protein [Devosia sp. DBB001]
MRTPARQAKPAAAQLKTWPAPRSGWIANTNLAQPGARNPDGTALAGAAVLDNMFPTATGVKLTRGSDTYATLGAGASSVTSLFTYSAGGAEFMFGATETTIYDITVVLQPNNAVIATENDDELATENDDLIGWGSTDGLDVVTGQTGGNWVSVQFATAGGVFLRLVNGTDTPLVFDGSAFDTLPALTFAAPDEAKDPKVLSYVWAYKQRLFFLENDSLDAWYLDVNLIGGELKKLPLGGVFELGGSLHFGASWSLDSGNQGGLSEQCIFVTTKGEVAVFQGSNPSDATDWGKVGVYRIGRPLGPKAWIRDGGDLIFATSIGYVRLSEAIKRELAALGPSAVSYPIEVAWNQAVDSRAAPWHCAVWPSKQMAVVALPPTDGQIAAMYLANVRTGAWCRRLNWEGTCLLLFKERLFFGTNEGTVVEANVTGLDRGQPYAGVCVPLFDQLDAPGSLKINEMVHVQGLAPVAVNVQTSIQRDYVVSLPPAPPASPVPVGNQWGAGIWGQSVWGVEPDLRPVRQWNAGAGEGYSLSPAIQLTSGAIVPLDYELISIENTYRVAKVIS